MGLACLVRFTLRFEELIGELPLTMGAEVYLQELQSDVQTLKHEKRSQLERLYQRMSDDLDKMIDAVGLKLAA